MSYTMALLLTGLVGGLVAVASNPSPYFAALGLVLVAGVGCGVVVGHGGGFLSLVLFLIYLGGMLVVFAYSAALAAEPYPENWFSSTVALYASSYLIGVGLVGGLFLGGWYEMGWVGMNGWGDLAQLRGDAGGVGFMYSLGGGGLVISAGVLLLTLFVVLELTRGLARGTIRAV
nr:NADH dehydrogenase subunit 6 [Xyrichtys martinicensis]